MVNLQSRGLRPDAKSTSDAASSDARLSPRGMARCRTARRNAAVRLCATAVRGGREAPPYVAAGAFDRSSRLPMVERACRVVATHVVCSSPTSLIAAHCSGNGQMQQARVNGDGHGRGRLRCRAEATFQRKRFPSLVHRSVVQMSPVRDSRIGSGQVLDAVAVHRPRHKGFPSPCNNLL